MTKQPKINLDLLTPKQLARYNDSLEVLRLMRHGSSFYKATNSVGISSSTVKKNLGNAITKKKNRIVARKSDNLIRHLRLYENGKETFIQVKGTNKSKKIAQYHSAIGQRLDKDNPIPLKAFKDSIIKDSLGKYHTFETDIKAIQEILLKQENPEFQTIYKVK